ncbi:hypothetical protein OCU04_003033 [Sclerotinia nivalis]|uniref:Uncharacterized protein n=1 Tax=Sclerotinia nivalis TaxID=352851 RepID=A0A9X0DN53_9HELO|nr:hypothetical protein OCU04_003033 [Sclerotinia nivalis]
MSTSTPIIDQSNRARSKSTSLNQPKISIHLRDRSWNSDTLQLSSDGLVKSKSMLDIPTLHQQDMAAQDDNTRFLVLTAVPSKNKDGGKGGHVDSQESLKEADVTMMRNIEHEAEHNECPDSHVPLDEFEMAKKRRKERRVHWAGCDDFAGSRTEQ